MFSTKIEIIIFYSKQNCNSTVFLSFQQIYTCINDKLVGLLLRARKHKFVDFEGEMLFQRRDDNVPIFMLKTTEEIKQILDEKIDEVRRSASPNPQPTNILIK